MGKNVLTRSAENVVSCCKSVLQIYSSEVEIVQATLRVSRRALMVMNDASRDSVKDFLLAIIPLMAHPHHPKIAKFARRTVLPIFKSKELNGAKEESFDCMVQFSEEVIRAPLETAAAVESATSSKIRSKLQDALDASVLSLVHWLSALASVLPHSSLALAQSIVERLWAVFSIPLPRLAAMTCDIFKALLSERGPVVMEAIDAREILHKMNALLQSDRSVSRELLTSFSEMTIAALRLVLKRESSAFVEELAKSFPLCLKLVQS